MDTSQELELKSELFLKLNKISSSIDYLQKEAKSYGYNYVAGSSLLNEIKPLMDANKVLLVAKLGEVSSTTWEHDKYDTRTKASKKVRDFTVECFNSFMVWVDCETGYEYSIPFYFSGTNDDISKAMGSAFTYFERYFLLKFFHIPTDEADPDSFKERHSDSDMQSEPPKQSRSQNKPNGNTGTQYITNAEAEYTRSLIAKYKIPNSDVLGLLKSVCDCDKLAQVKTKDYVKLNQRIVELSQSNHQYQGANNVQ